ncbi:MAG: glycosyltransferase family 9 protein [Bacteroidota bacterium]|jgi:ADP-heptose:LPS heptosyltransferase
MMDDAAVERILVLRRHNHIGDMLCSLPLFAALRKRWPSASITLLATPTRYPIPLHEVNPFIDVVEYYEKGTLGEVLRVHRSLRKRRFDLAIVPSTIAISRTSHLTAFFSGARIRVGIRSLDGTKNPLHRFLNVKADVHWNGEHVHQEERNREIASLVGCEISAEEIRALRIPRPADEDRLVSETLGTWAAGRPLIGVHPGAGKPQNIWPTDRFADILAELSRAGNGDVLITGGVLDEAPVSSLSAQLTDRGIEHRILRELPLPVLSSVFRRMRLYLTNDTGTMHIAAYSGCPTVSLFGPTASWEWGPRGEHHRSVQSNDGTMDGIPAERVRLACNSLLNL